MDIEGRTALVTGGASGLGRATVEGLVGAGARVVIVDLPDSDGGSVAASLGDVAAFAPADVTDPDDVTAAVETAIQRFGGLHVAVSCAGIAAAMRTVGREGPHDLDVFRRVVEVNLVGTFNVARLAAARMVSQEPVDDEERGVIVNTASIAAFDGQVGQAAYAASKGGVVSLTLTIARDLAGRGVRCLTIAPGTFDTPMLGGLPEEARQALASNVQQPGRLGRPEEYALLVRQLVANPYVNGEVVRLDGGLRMPPR